MNGKEIMLVSAVGAGLVIAFYAGVYKPASGEIERLHGAMHAYQGLDIREKVTEETRVKKKIEADALEETVSRLAERLLADDGDMFMKELRQYCVEADVSDVSVKRKGVTSKGGQTYLSFGVRMKGLFDDVYQFLLAVETSGKNIWFDSIKLSRALEVDGAVQLDLTLSVPKDAE